jgi:glycosyltransferase involved in cell wall biosynthesis
MHGIEPMMKRLLVIAFHFPPFAGSSGVQRTLRFVQHLPRFGWEAIVLTSHPRAYEGVTPDLMRDIPSGTVVERAFALDTARHLAIGERYPGWLARPDRWVTWWSGAVLSGRRMLRKYRPAAIFSTYPIATAHLIGDSLARASGLPWIADFRDPMAQDRYPNSASRLEVIENGYDEDAFADVPKDSQAEPLNAGVLTILHSGIVYPDERDPTQLFAALVLLKARGIDGRRLRVRFRAAVHDELLNALAKMYFVEDMVEVMPHLPYREALREMLRADGLLVLQAANCNAQVPAKLYEYLRARRPLLALTDPEGDTAAVLRASGSNAIARLDSAADIADLIGRFVDGDRQEMFAVESAIAGASREARTEQLARLIDGLCPGARR